MTTSEQEPTDTIAVEDVRACYLALIQLHSALRNVDTESSHSEADGVLYAVEALEDLLDGHDTVEHTNITTDTIPATND